MSRLSNVVDKVKPFYDWAYKIILTLCKLLLITDILIAVMTVIGRYVSFVPDPAWSEHMILTLMSYMAVLSAALAIRNRSHIRMTVFDKFLPRKLIFFLDILSDIFVLGLGIVMMVVGWKYAVVIGAKGFYTSMPKVSRFWMYFPIPLAGVAMIIFQLEVTFYNIKVMFTEEADV